MTAEWPVEWNEVLSAVEPMWQDLARLRSIRQDQVDGWGESDESVRAAAELMWFKPFVQDCVTVEQVLRRLEQIAGLALEKRDQYPLPDQREDSLALLRQELRVQRATRGWTRQRYSRVSDNFHLVKAWSFLTAEILRQLTLHNQE